MYYRRTNQSKFKRKFVPIYKTSLEFERDVRMVFEWNEELALQLDVIEDLPVIEVVHVHGVLDGTVICTYSTNQCYNIFIANYSKCY